MVSSRTPRPAILFPRSVAQPPGDVTPRGADSGLTAETLGLATRLAAVLIIGAAFVFTVGVFTGKRLERGSELGVLLAYGPRLAAIDSVLDSSRAVLKRWARPVPQRTLPRKVENGQ